MFSLRRPSARTLRRILIEAGERDVTYAAVGATRLPDLPRGFPHHRHAVELGRGAPVYRRARAALLAWRMYDLGWTEVCWPGAPEPGHVFGVLVRHGLIWSFNPCRVVYREESAGPAPSFRFAIGTLPGHSETGEEAFTVEMQDDESVWYRIRSFARAQDRWARLTPWIVRHFQGRFGEESLTAMKRAIRAA